MREKERRALVVSSSLLLSSSLGREQAEVLSIPFLLLAQNR
jgi:hypothetical protein